MDRQLEVIRLKEEGIDDHCDKEVYENLEDQNIEPNEESVRI